MGGRKAGVALVAAVLSAWICPGAGAEDSSSATRFWLQQTQPNPQAEPLRPHHPTFRPRRRVASAEPQRRPAPPSTATASRPAFVVAVFGDAFGFDAARGLADAYGENTQAGVVDETDETAGLAGVALPSWSAAIDDATKLAGHLDAAVMMLGGTDLHSFTDLNGAQAELGTPAWHDAYADRVRRTGAAFRDRNIALIWVGLPVVRDAELARRYAELNAIVRENAPASGAVYVDSWEAFTDENGHYESAGPDVDGQQTKLRRDDGRHFTHAGARKLASFIEPELRRVQEKAEASAKLAAITVTDAEVFDQALAIDVNAQIRREAGLGPIDDSAHVKDGPVVELTAAPMATDGRLATAGTAVAVTANTEAVFSTGLAPPVRQGRTDDFRWPRP